jgi:hypothetical protein
VEAKLPDEFIPTREALRRVRGVLFGAEAVGELTERESWLIKRYVAGGRLALRRPPGSAALRAEVERAHGKQEQRSDQLEQAQEWLERQGFRLRGRGVRPEELERALGAAQPAQPSTSTTNKKWRVKPDRKLT